MGVSNWCFKADGYVGTFDIGLQIVIPEDLQGILNQ